MRAFVLPLLSLVAALPACVSYDLGQEQAVTEFSSGNPEVAIAQYQEDDFTGSAFLSDTEVGTVTSALGSWDLAQENFHAAPGTREEDQVAGAGIHGHAEVAGRSFLHRMLDQVFLRTNVAAFPLAQGQALSPDVDFPAKTAGDGESVHGSFTRQAPPASNQNDTSGCQGPSGSPTVRTLTNAQAWRRPWTQISSIT